ERLAVTAGWLAEIANEATAPLVTVYDVETGKELLVLRGHTKRTVLAAFDADGKRLATTSKDGTVRVWDANTGAPLQTLTAPGAVIGVVFSPDGKQVAAGTDAGKNPSVLVWDLEQGGRRSTD